MNRYRELVTKIDEKYKEIHALRKEQIELSKGHGLEEVENYYFKDVTGSQVSLIDFFGNHDELIVVHNMGKSCPYCTLWADGLSSSNPHIQNRAAFVLTSPDDVDTMREFAKDRDWRFPYYSAAENTFTFDMGFQYDKEDGKKQYWPGFTTFLKKDDKIFRVACDTFGPGDFYSPIWGMVEMLHHSDKDWHPKYKY